MAVIVMQNTRLNVLGDRLSRQLAVWILNPWRRLAVLVISLLFGNFFASVVSTIAGQYATLDVIVALWGVSLSEIISWLRYRRSPQRNQPALEIQDEPKLPQAAFWLDALNKFKLGFIYGLFVEAFKLGS
jgi:hypothetical protein